MGLRDQNVANLQPPWTGHSQPLSKKRSREVDRALRGLHDVARAAGPRRRRPSEGLNNRAGAPERMEVISFSAAEE